MFPFILSLTAQEVEERLNSISNKLDKDAIRQSLANPSSTTVPSTQAMADVLGPLSEGIEDLGILAGKDSVALDTSEVTGVLPISKGGTGALSLEQAQQNLGILSEEDITTLIESVIPEIGDVQLDSAQTSGVLPISKGGSGAQTTQQARINLGVWSASQSETVRDNVNESLRRSYTEAGYNVVGTFREGFTIVNANDVGIDETTGKGFSGPAGTVAAGTDPSSGGFVDVSTFLLRTSVTTLGEVTGAQFGIKMDGSPTADEFEAAIRYCKTNNRTLLLQAGTIFFERNIDVSDVSGSAVIIGPNSQHGRQQFTNASCTIRFNDDGTGSGIGIDFGENSGPVVIRHVSLQTLIEDARTATGSFIGIRADGRTSAIFGCLVKGFTTAFEMNDLGYANWGNNYYVGNKTMLKHSLSQWPFGTTFRDDFSQSVKNGVVYDVLGLWHSSWTNGVHEYATTVIKDAQSGCTLQSNYFENVTKSFASLNAADLVDIGNYYHTTSMEPVIGTNVVVHGFNRIGLTRISRGEYTGRKFNFFDRSGVLTRAIAATDATGELQVLDAAGASLGYIAACSSKKRNYTFVIFKGVASDLPSGWTLTKNAVGELTVSFGGNFKNPIINITPIPANVSSGVASHTMRMTEGAGGNWSTFANASGFKLYTYINSAASDDLYVSISILV